MGKKSDTEQPAQKGDNFDSYAASFAHASTFKPSGIGHIVLPKEIKVAGETPSDDTEMIKADFSEH